MPNPVDLLGRIVRFVGDVLGASSLRFEVGPTLAVLAVLLILLQLVARPVTRWTTTGDAAGLAGVGRSMAIAAEAGTDAVVSLGAGGLTRATDALARLQTLAALPILAHVARAAARSGVPLRVLTNDPLAAVAATATLEAAHARTDTRERAGRSRVVVVGEGRPVMGGLVMTAAARPSAAFAFGSLREEAQLHLEGLGGGAGSLSAGTAEPSQAPSVLLTSPTGLIGPELYRASADLRADVSERTSVLAANRLIAILVIGAITLGALSLAGIVEPGILLGSGG